MPSWSEVQTQAPELARAAQERFEAKTHHTIATIRRDGSPRISGIECLFAHDELWTGSMWSAMKALDLRRDPRFCLYAQTSDPPEWTGDARISGTAEEIEAPKRFEEVYGHKSPGRSHLFRLDVSEIVTVGLNEKMTKLLIESWVDGRGQRLVER